MDFGFGNLGLGEGLLGLSVLGDLGGAVSNYFQQQKMNDIRKKSMDPNAMAGYANTYAQNIYNTTSPQIARQAASSLGSGGVADGAYGNALMQQALAQYMGQLQQQGAQAYQGNMNTALNAVGPAYGTSGASMDAMKMLMMMHALKGNKEQPQSGITDPSTLAYNGPGMPMNQWATSYAPPMADVNSAMAGYSGYPLGTMDG